MKEKQESNYSDQNLNEMIFDCYDILVKKQEPNTKKTKLLFCEKNECFVLKETDKDLSKTYEYLQSLGVSNIIYPKTNKYNSFSSISNNKFVLLYPYYQHSNNFNEKNTIDLFHELKQLHYNTAFPRKLKPEEYRKKFDEISNRLDYKFKLFEEYIRSIENSKINYDNYQILSKYYVILNCKIELIRLQKRIIISIKDEETVNYSFIHNNPKSEHLLYVKGNKFLTSLDFGKIGIESLDYAKFYVENSQYNVNLKKIIEDELLSYETDFYYDYFRFIVLYIFINRIIISNDLHLTSKIFVNSCNEIEKFLNEFKDRIKNND